MRGSLLSRLGNVWMTCLVSFGKTRVLEHLLVFLIAMNEENRGFHATITCNENFKMPSNHSESESIIKLFWRNGRFLTLNNTTGPK